MSNRAKYNTPIETPLAQNDPCASPTPTPTPSATVCPTPTPSSFCPPPPLPDCVMDMSSCYPVLTYRVVSVCGDEITLDRPTPDFSYLNNECYARALVYPPKMTEIYDSYTPLNHWSENVINYESICTTDEFDVKIWNMNIPWSENPAGLISSSDKDYTNFGSVDYLGTKEYLGYASQSGQTDTSSVFYYNSFDERITLKPEDQKAIAIIHYTNNTIDYFYGEKFALEPGDPNNPEDNTIGLAKNFKMHIPWIMWHKNPECCNGQTFWVDPPGFEDKDLFQVCYLESKKNVDMNNPGIRYYHLWDNNANTDGFPSRVGKVFPDHKIVVIDDEELIAAMSYKANRNWTLPAPKISLITPNICGPGSQSPEGILTGDTEYLYVTYRLTNNLNCLNGLHCNYYSFIQGANTCLPLGPQNVGVRFGAEFPCLSQPFVPISTTTTTTTIPPTTTTTTTISPCSCWKITGYPPSTFIVVDDVLGNKYTLQIVPPEVFVCSCSEPVPVNNPITTQLLGQCGEDSACSAFTFTMSEMMVDTYQNPMMTTTTTTTIYPTTTTTTTSCPSNCDIIKGFYANKFEIICQKVDSLGRPNSSGWKVIDFTEQLMPSMVNGFITQEGLTGNTFVITQELYDNASTYNLDNYVPITPIGFSGTQLNFGDEYYFYGNLETDIQATIYEMRYKINLSQSEFQASSNPTWTPGTPSYVSEIALYDSDKNLMIISKTQSPVLRQGIQQFLIKFDF